MASRETDLQAHAPTDSVSRSQRVREVVATWAFGALAAGLWQVAVVTAKQEIRDTFTWTGRDFVWMSPLGFLIVMGFPAIVFVLLALVSPRFAPRPVFVGVLAFIAATGIAILVPGLAEWAIIVFALGVAVQSVRLVRARPERWFARFRGAAIVMAAIVAALGVSTRLWRNSAEWRWSRSAAAAPREAPNVLVLILDTVRASRLSLYGFERPTSPELVRVAAGATTYDYAMATAPWTLPSHCSFFTGRYPNETSCRWQAPLDGKPTTLAEVMRGRGYRTAGFIANHFYGTYETGLSRGFTRWDDFQTSFMQIVCSTTLVQTGVVRDFLWPRGEASRWRWLKNPKLKGDPKPLNDRKPAPRVNAQFLAWAAADTSRPYFAVLNYFDAHDPYHPPRGWDTLFTKDAKPVDNYDRSVAYLDHHIGALVRTLEANGTLDRTVLVILSDHGEQFGEHELINHGNSMYLPLLHVPLMIRYPARMPSGARIADVVSLRDIPATILDLAGVPNEAGLPGTSLAGMAHPENGVRSAAVAQTEQTERWWGPTPTRRGSMESLLDDRLHYIRISNGEEQLFEYRSDYAELTDLAKVAPWSDSLPRLREELKSRSEVRGPRSK
jgi:arylsulfatase A-like enzyme